MKVSALIPCEVEQLWGRQLRPATDPHLAMSRLSALDRPCSSNSAARRMRVADDTTGDQRVGKCVARLAACGCTARVEVVS